MKLFQSMLKVYWRKAGKSPPHKTDVTRDGSATQRSEIPEAKGPEWDVCQRKAKGTTKEKSIPNKVIIVIPPKFESNVHVSHAKAHAKAAPKERA